MRTSSHSLLFVALAACGGSNASPIPVTSFGIELGKVACQKSFQCCTDTELMQEFKDLSTNGQPITTEQQCEQALGALGAFVSQQYQASIAAGRVTYDEAAAGDCIATLKGLSCPEYAANQHDADLTLAGCMQFLVPAVDTGGTCSQDYECKTSNCAFDSSGTSGTCQPMPTQGQDCTGNCASGSYCAFDAAQNKTVCTSTKPDGASCLGNNECATGTCDSSTSTCAAVCDGR